VRNTGEGSATIVKAVDQKLQTLVQHAISLGSSNQPVKHAAQDLAAWLKRLPAAVQVGLGVTALFMLILFPRVFLILSGLLLATAVLSLFILQRYGGKVQESRTENLQSTSQEFVEEELGLQEKIEAAQPGTTLRIDGDEYEGPITIEKPLVLKGESAVIWARRGPALTVDALGVRLENLSVEVTAPDNERDEEANIALKLADGVQASLENIRVRGRVVGLDEEDGDWMLPTTLDLGTFAPRERNTFVFKVSVPIKCQLSSNVAGLEVEPNTLEAGEQDVTLTVQNFPVDTLIFGHIDIRTVATSRIITVTGGTVNSSDVSPASDIRL
jgi:membrane protein implicated in regulation of membrane protease activity